MPFLCFKSTDTNLPPPCFTARKVLAVVNPNTVLGSLQGAGIFVSLDQRIQPLTAEVLVLPADSPPLLRTSEVLFLSPGGANISINLFTLVLCVIECRLVGKMAIVFIKNHNTKCAKQ